MDADDHAAMLDLRRQVDNLLSAIRGRYAPAVHRLERAGQPGAEELQETLRLCRLDSGDGSLYRVSLALSALLDGTPSYRR